jgi:VWFA-related protein
VTEELAPADWVAVVSYQRSLQVHEDFTRDRGAIVKALERVGAGREGRYAWPSRREEQEGPALTDDLPHGRALVKETTRVYDALSLVAEASRDIRGRKNLVYFGIGFGDVDNFGQYREDSRYYPDTVRALNDANVAAYALDLAPFGAHHAFEGALSQLAHDTGGRAFLSLTTFITPLAQIAEENTGYYLLSYRAAHPRGEKGFQQVTVETRDPDLKVRARRGYLYGDDEGDAG